MNRRTFIRRAAGAINGAAGAIALSPSAPGVRSLNAAAAPLIVDSHVQVWKHDAKFPFAEGAHPPAEDASAAMLLDLMKANGVSRTVIVQVIHYKWDNSYVAGVLKRYRGLFHGVCRMNPEDPAAPDELSRWTEHHGFRGVRLSPSAKADGDWIRGPLMPPFRKRCEKPKVPMTLLVPAKRLPDVAPPIEKYPELTVVIDHQPEKLDWLPALERYPKVFVKIGLCENFPYVDSFEASIFL